jgi:hypothetical protein
MSVNDHTDSYTGVNRPATSPPSLGPYALELPNRSQHATWRASSRLTNFAAWAVLAGKTPTGNRREETPHSGARRRRTRTGASPRA